MGAVADIPIECCYNLNQGPADYEGGGLRVYPVPSNLNQLDDSLFFSEKSTGFCWLVLVQYVKRCTVFAPLNEGVLT
jgi:hypothetical protein